MSTCTCDDRLVEELRELVAAGYDQRAVSHLLWGDGAPVSNELAVQAAGIEARRTVRAAYAAAFPWLRLAARSGTEVC